MILVVRNDLKLRAAHTNSLSDITDSRSHAPDLVNTPKHPLAGIAKHSTRHLMTMPIFALTMQSIGKVLDDFQLWNRAHNDRNL